MAYDSNMTQIIGWMDVVEGRSRGEKYDLIDGLSKLFYAAGNYGASWGSVSLPSSPVDGRAYLRYNLDTSTLRLYVYAGGSWHYLEFT